MYETLFELYIKYANVKGCAKAQDWRSPKKNNNFVKSQLLSKRLIEFQCFI